ncbi:histidine phosphatase family protein [Halobacillus locisalis]|uniref:Histidine phosphatase family protein n=1 Tax=Halobacillus locisalis TaxID=220753 RepID=A0A838CQ92_9BACI|nr:histidine phosphatase family protein [Halobacillus locisalis]MBA2174160.1 histidine phosphatase family protein [Halobacillus locisalis]
MNLVFIRHGEGEHTRSTPESLHIPRPNLTSRGREQAEYLNREWKLNQGDLLVMSPTIRTIETALIWSEGVDCTKVVDSRVGPRMFPVKPEWTTLPCDRRLEPEEILSQFPEVKVETWGREINQMKDHSFTSIANEFLHWCELQGVKRIFIVTHDGTITAYKQHLTGKSLKRKDLPEEATGFEWEL